MRAAFAHVAQLLPSPPRHPHAPMALLALASALLLQLAAASGFPGALTADHAVLYADTLGSDGFPDASLAALPARWALAAQEEPSTSPALDFIRQMTALDVLLILVWLGIFIYGIATGVIRQLILIVSLLLGALVGALVAGPASVWGAIATASTREAALPATYAIMVVLITLLIFSFGMRVYPETRLGRYVMIDHVGGAILGFVAGLISISMIVGILLVLVSQPWVVLDETRNNIRLQLASTPFLPLIAATFPLVTQMIANSLPVPVKDICERCL